MSDDRDNPAGPPPEPPAPPPLAAEPPPLAPAPPPAPAAPAPPPAAAAAPPAAPAAPPAAAAYAPAPAKPLLPWIIAGGIALVLAILAILYFTGVFGGRGGWIVGTWGPGCPSSRAQSVTFTSDGRFIAGGGTGTYTMSGNTVTLRRNRDSDTMTMQWEQVSENRARVTMMVGGRSDTDHITRCTGGM